MSGWARLRAWMLAIPIADQLRREQAAILQSFITILGVASLLGIPLSLTATSAVDQVSGVISSLIQLLLLAVAIAVLRRGGFRTSVALVIVSMIIFAALNMIPTGLEGSRSVFTVLTVPIVLGGLLGGRRLLVLAAILTMLLVIGVAVLSSAAPTLVGYSQERYDPVLTCAVYLVMAVVLSVLIDRFGGALQAALERARARERELDELRVSLEQQVADRTESLQATVDQLRASQATISMIGAPVLPVLPGVLVAPLIGLFDSARAAALRDKILAAVDRQRAKTVIFDLTGMDIVDPHTVAELLQLSAAVRLLGADSVIVGVRAEFAIAMVELRIDLRAQRIFPNLQEAVAALQRPAG